MVIPITYKCDAHCKMCGIWKLKPIDEITVSDFETILSDRVFETIERISITGGEPTLRPDLVDIVKLLVKKMPHLESVGISTNGLKTQRIVQQCAHLTQTCSNRGVQLRIGLSLDGIGSVHNKIRGIPNAFEKATATLFQLKKLEQHYTNCSVGIQATISCHNVQEVYSILNWCKKQNLDYSFIPASVKELLYNRSLQENININKKSREFVISFYKMLAREGKKDFASSFAAYRYNDIANMLGGQPNRTPCPFQIEGFYLDCRGNMYYCSSGKKIGNCLHNKPSNIYFNSTNIKYRNRMIKELCPSCITGGCFYDTSLQKEVLRYLRFLLFAK